MEDSPLDIKIGDVVALSLAHPIRFDDGSGGEDLRYQIRIQVDQVTAVGISGRGADEEPGPITPTRDGRGTKLGGRARFFPWSAIASMVLLDTFQEYEAAWDGKNQG